MPLQLKGVAAMANKIHAVSAKFKYDVPAALYYEANVIMTESKKRCPRSPDGGTLRASGHVQDPVVQGKRISVTMGYGGAASDYAVAVHEHLSEHSPPSWRHKEDIDWTIPGTGPKYLEGPIKEAVPGLKGRIAQRLAFTRGVV